MKPTNFNILITSLSDKVPLILAVKAASKKLGNEGKIIGADIDKNCIGSYFVDHFYEIEKLSDINLNSFLEYCKSNNIKAIIPTRDGELLWFAKNMTFFSKHGIAIMISEAKAIESCIDKLKFAETLEKKNFPTIKTTNTIDNLDAASFVVKEQFGAGSRSIGLNLDRSNALNHSLKLEHPMFQPFIKGEEISVDIYYDKAGKAKGGIARKRILVVNGESQITTTFNSPEIIELCSKAGEQLGLYGHAVWQVIIDENNKPQIIECNSRFGGASTLSVACGLDSFYWFLLESENSELSKHPFIPNKTIRTQIRYKTDKLI